MTIYSEYSSWRLGSPRWVFCFFLSFFLSLQLLTVSLFQLDNLTSGQSCVQDADCGSQIVLRDAQCLYNSSFATSTQEPQFAH
jgi:hypothetical protein